MLKYHARAQPLQYPHCTMTATVYHVCFNPWSCRRAVLQGVYLERRADALVDKTGTKPGSSVVLVIPQKAALRVSPAADAGVAGTYVLQAGDRVVAGVGPEIADREAWGQLVPAKYDVTTLAWVEQKYLNGQPCHVEAGDG